MAQSKQTAVNDVDKLVARTEDDILDWKTGIQSVVIAQTDEEKQRLSLEHPGMSLVYDNTGVINYFIIACSPVVSLWVFIWG